MSAFRMLPDEKIEICEKITRSNLRALIDQLYELIYIMYEGVPRSFIRRQINAISLLKILQACEFYKIKFEDLIKKEDDS